jgi:outer membrane protein OmpA-like peptidoglycan-associated protein
MSLTARSLISPKRAALALFLGLSALALGAMTAPSQAADNRMGGGGFHGHGFGSGFQGRGFGPGFRGFGPGFRGGFGFRGPGCCWGGFAWGGPWAWGWPGYAYGYPYAYPYPYPYAYPYSGAAAAPPPPPPPPGPGAQAAPTSQTEFTVYFEFDRYDLTPDATRVVDRAIAAAGRGGPSRIAVVGNTDSSGTAGYNVELSQRRAETVRRYMVAHGIARGDIEIRAMGKSDPAVRTADGVREPRNRRVEIVITPRNAPVASRGATPVEAMTIPTREEAMRALMAGNVSTAAMPADAPASNQIGPPTNLVNP